MKKILCAIAIILAFICLLASCNEKQSTEIHINEDGYWVINGEKTNVKAQGEKGDDGADATVVDENPQGLAFFLKDDGTYAVGIGYAKYLSKIEIPDTYKGKAVTEVGRFSDDTGNTILTEIIIPNSVILIGARAFKDCSNLMSVTIGNSVITIGDSAFYNCANLTSVTIPNSVTIIEDSAFRDCSNLTSATIPDSVTTIGNSVFNGCSNLTSVMIPDSVTTIGNYVFYDCSNLTSVTIPDSITTIGNSMFLGCTNLASVTIPDSVTIIGNCVFYNCSNLTSVVIPDSVISIGYDVFYSCSNLTSVTFPNSNGWWCTRNENATSGTAISASDLSIPSTAAEYLKYNYRSYYWYRTE